MPRPPRINPHAHAVTQPAFDPSAFETLRASVSDDATFLAELVADYLEDAEEHVTTLQQAASEGRVEQLERTAHSLKSTSETVGALALAEVCRTIETLAHEGKLEQAARHVPEAAAQFDAVEGELRTHQSALEAEC